MFWYRVLGIAPPGEAAPTRRADVRYNAVLHHHQRALSLLERELKLYEIEADRDRPQC